MRTVAALVPGLAIAVLIAAFGAAVLVWVGSGLPGSGAPSAAPSAAHGSARTAASATSAEGTSFRFWARDEGGPVRWNPCRPIRWVLNPDGAPEGARAALRGAMRRLTVASGLRFRFAGTTGEVPSARRPVYQPDRYGDRWAPVLIAWTTPRRQQLPLRDSDRAVAVPVAVRRSGTDVFVTGQIALNRAGTTADAGPDGPSLEATILHELGHLAGLDHVDDPGQLMHRFPGRGAEQLGDGDFAGLRRLGREAGCHATPDPGPVEVAYATPRRRAMSQPR